MVLPGRPGGRVGRRRDTIFEAGLPKKRPASPFREGKDELRDPLAFSRIALIGSGEFTPSMADIDREILATIGDWALVHRPEDGDGTPTRWAPGLAMLQGAAVVPHFDAWAEAERLTAEIADVCEVFGIDEDTAVLLDGGRAHVAGRGIARLI